MRQSTLKRLIGMLWGTDPGTLQRLFMVVGSLSIAVILLTSAWGFKAVFTSHVVRMAEEDAVAVCEMMLDFAQHNIMKGVGVNRSIVVTPEDISRLDHDTAPFLDHLHVTKVKIFDHESRIVYSTDKKVIGKIDEKNPRLMYALNGAVDTKLKEKRVGDLAEEKGFTVKIVETYVPIKNDIGQVVGAFEVYLLIDKYEQALRRGQLLTTLIMAVVLFGAFAVSHRIIGQSVRQVRDAHGLLQQVAITDGLTGVANHGYLVLRGREEFDRAKRSYSANGEKGLGCILLDLDHFKQINDRYGHLVGDQVLKSFVQRVQAVLRPYDLLGRYGGEEFMVLIPETSARETCLVAQRILEGTRRQPFETDAGPLTVTSSAGANVSLENDSCFEELLKRADDYLYQAKHNGRDRVCCAPDAACVCPGVDAG